MDKRFYRQIYQHKVVPRVEIKANISFHSLSLRHASKQNDPTQPPSRHKHNYLNIKSHHENSSIPSKLTHKSTQNKTHAKLYKIKAQKKQVSFHDAKYACDKTICTPCMSAAFIGESQLGVCLQLSSGKANWAVTAPSCKQPYGRTEGTIQASFDHTLRFKWVWSTPVQSISSFTSNKFN